MSSLNERALWRGQPCAVGAWRGQISAAGILIGCIGCIIITASSVYTALKMGALPWPTIFTSITALVLLRAAGRTSLNEANVTQIIMSAGSMVAGGLAFTIPGVWMLGLDAELSWIEIGGVALAGTLLGLVCTALIRRRFVEESDLEYPIGTAAAETLMASRAGGATGKRLFGSMAAAGAWCALRDVAGVVPAMIGALPIPGVAFGIYNSPMLLSVGFLVGGAAVAFWLAGGLIANFGIIVGGSSAGLWDVATAQGIVASLGMGLMMGSGIGVVVRDILPGVIRDARAKAHGIRAVSAADGDGAGVRRGLGRLDAGALALLVAAAALLICLVLALSPLACIVVVALAFVTTIMSAQSVGQTGIDPMEIFGLIVLLAVAAVSNVPQVQLFFVAGVVSVACGLAGDVMNDFKAGHILGTDPRAQWLGQAAGAVLGAVVAVSVMYVLVGAYGADAFGPGKEFVAAQASVVATMIAGIPSAPAFAIGLTVGFVLQIAGLPAMMLGLGVYLPFYMSFTAALGMVAKLVYDAVCKARNRRKREALIASGAADVPSLEQMRARSDESGLVVASGLLGGESVVGVIIALSVVLMGM